MFKIVVGTILTLFAIGIIVAIITITQVNKRINDFYDDDELNY